MENNFRYRTPINNRETHREITLRFSAPCWWVTAGFLLKENLLNRKYPTTFVEYKFKWWPASISSFTPASLVAVPVCRKAYYSSTPGAKSPYLLTHIN